MIKKAILLAAGKGSRMQPITQAIPKPMLPVLSKPVLDYIIEECFEAGIEEICIIVGHQKHVIKDYFEEDSRISFITQKELTGTGGALETARIFIKDEPFAVLFTDEILDSDTSLLKKMMDCYDESNYPFISGIDRVPLEKIKEYNSITFVPTSGDLVCITSIVEKPNVVPSDNATCMGRFIFSPAIFDELAELKFHHNGEKYLTDALFSLIKENKLFGYEYSGKRFDTGSIQGWLETNLHFSNK